jgi:hypothetical protein
MYMVDDGELHWIGAESAEDAMRIYKEWNEDACEIFDDEEECIEITELPPEKTILFRDDENEEEHVAASELLIRYGEGVIASSVYF